MTQDKSPELDIDFIEVIEPILDTTNFVIALAIGIAVGIGAFYAYQEWQRTQADKLAPEPVIYEAEDEATPAIPTSVPEWAGS